MCQKYINKCWYYSKEGDTLSSWNYEKLYKEGRGENTGNRAFWNDVGRGEEYEQRTV